MRNVKLPDLHNLAIAARRQRTLLILAVVIVSFVVTGFVGTQQKVSIIADGQTVNVVTFNSSPALILAQAGVSLGAKDEYKMSSPKFSNASIIEVYRAISVNVILKDRTETIVTAKQTAGEVAASLGFTPNTGKTLPGEKTKVTPNMDIKIIALTEQFVKSTEPIEAPVERHPDANLERGAEEVVVSGQGGVKEVTVRLRFEDGSHVSSDIVAEKVISAPVAKVLRVGTRSSIWTSRGEEIRFREIYTMHATAYNPWDGNGEGITATGIQARHGVVAVDPRVIPLGSRLYIPGYGYALAADTGGAIIGNRIDLCMETLNEALSFGRRMVKVYLVE